MEKQQRYRKHPKGVDLYFYVPPNIVEYYICSIIGQLEYIDVLGFGEIPIQRHSMEMLKYEGFDIDSIDWTDFAHGFFDGYSTDFATNIGTIESKKEAIIKTVSNQKSICVTGWEEKTLNNLYDDGCHHGRQYKAWEIIFETPNEFVDFFNTENTDKSKPQQLYFTRSFTDTERQNLFNGLVSGGFIHKSTNANDFDFVFGGAETADFKPLQWQRTVALLAYFIDVFFADTDSTNLWEITKRCFTIKGKEPNTDTLKNTVSKYKQGNKSKPKNHDKIDTILYNL